MEIEKRDLDGAYFRIKRDGKWGKACFTDLTDEEMDAVLNGQTEMWLKSLCKHLGKTLRCIGDKFDIRYVDDEKEEK